MRHAYDKALDIATQLMTAQLQGTGRGNTNHAEETGKYFLKLVEIINTGLEKIPD